MISFGMRIRFVRKSLATRATPRCLVLRIVPCCLPQPKMHSIILRRVPTYRSRRDAWCVHQSRSVLSGASPTNQRNNRLYPVAPSADVLTVRLRKLIATKRLAAVLAGSTDGLHPHKAARRFYSYQSKWSAGTRSSSAIYENNPP